VLDGGIEFHIFPSFVNKSNAGEWLFAPTDGIYNQRIQNETGSCRGEKFFARLWNDSPAWSIDYFKIRANDYSLQP